MFGMTDVIRSVSTGRAETSVFHGLSFGKMRQPPCIVPGPAVPPPELLVLLVDPLDDPPPDDDAAPELDVELAPPLDDEDDAFSPASLLAPQATTTQIPKTTAAPRMDAIVTLLKTWAYVLERWWRDVDLRLRVRKRHRRPLAP